MEDKAKDQRVLDHIKRLVTEEHRLYAQGSLAEADRERLTKFQVELDRDLSDER